eukprot:s7463_g3.t1
MDADLTLSTTMAAGEAPHTFTLLHSALHSKSGKALKILVSAGLRHDGKPLSEMLETEAMLDVQSFPAMMMPDYALIGEIMFYAYGFTEAKILAKKMARAS